MRKKVFVICDRDEAYVDRFGSYLERREGSPFEVHGFTEPEALAAYLAEGQADILLVGQELAADGLWQLAGERCRVRLRLADEPVPDSEADLVYRYQSAEKILRQALARYEQTMDPPEERKKLRTEIYGVYSPVKRCYKTTFSLILGQLLAERETTLYLNLEDCSGHPWLTGDTAENLSDILYCYRVEQPGHVKLYSAVRQLGKLAYIPPVVCPGDIREASPEDLARVITAIGSREEYRFLVLDLGDALRDPLPLLRLCCRIYLPLREDAVSRARVEHFSGWLKEKGESELLRRIRRLILPDFAHMGAMPVDAEDLRLCPLGHYVERKLQEVEGWSG